MDERVSDSVSGLAQSVRELEDEIVALKYVVDGLAGRLG